MAMEKLIKISDSLIVTYLVKTVFFFLISLIVLSLRELLDTIDYTDIINYLVFICSAAIIYHLLRFCLLAKSITHDNHYFYISSIWNTHKIKIDQLDQIKQSFIMKQTVPAHMMILFKESNILFNKVIFIPNHQIFNSKSNKNLLEEIKISLHQASGRPEKD